MKLVSFIRRRLGERSTWVGIGLAVGAASAFPPPWSWLSLVVGTLGAIVPDGDMPTP